MVVSKRCSFSFVICLTLTWLTNNRFGLISSAMALTADTIDPSDYRQHYFRDSETDIGYRDINHVMMQRLSFSFEESDNSKIIKNEDHIASGLSLKRFQKMQHLDMPHHFVSVRNHIQERVEPSPFSPKTLDRQLYSNVISSRNYISCTKISIAATFILGVAIF